MPSRRALLATAGAVGATGLAGCSAFSAPDDVDARADSADWPLVHHDARNTNRNFHATPPRSAPDVRWSARLHAPDADAFGGYAFVPSPAVVGDRVYVGGERLTCRRVVDGGVEWSASADSGPYHGVGIAGDGDGLFVVTGGSHPQELTAFDPDGEPRWTVEYDRQLVSAPLAAGGVVYVAGRESQRAVRAGDGRPLWSVHTGLAGTLPAVDSMVRYTAVDSGQGIAARSSGRGVLAGVRGQPPPARWRARVEGGRNMLAVGPDYLAHAAVDGGASVYGANVHVLSPDGIVEWSRTVEGEATNPVVGDGAVYQRYGTNPTEVDHGDYRNVHFDARVVAHDAADGTVRWEQSVPKMGDWRIEPVLADGTLYVPLHDGRNDRSLVRAYDAADGTERWTEPLDSPAVHLAAVGSALVVTTHGGRLLVWE